MVKIFAKLCLVAGVCLYVCADGECMFMSMFVYNVYVCAGDIATDDRSYEMHLTNAMDVASSNVYFYPRLIPIVSSHSPSLCPVPIHCLLSFFLCCWVGY